MDEKTFNRYFKAFGDPTRRRILHLLSYKEMTVNEIVKAINLSQPTVSRHLALLRDAEIVNGRREGQKVYYSLNKNSVKSCCNSFCDDLKIQGSTTKRSKIRQAYKLK